MVVFDSVNNRKLARFCKYQKSFPRYLLFFLKFFSTWLVKGGINYTIIALINRLLTNIVIEQQRFTQRFNL